MTLSIICGVDEAGRGPWAGPVCAGAVILGEGHGIEGLGDSKVLSVKARERLAVDIRHRAVAWGLGWASSRDIDRINIRQATHLAMRRAVTALFHDATEILVDGNDLPDGLPTAARAIVGGDGSVADISAASILAKTARDHHMASLDERFPGYGFAAHKGYGTAAHKAALETLGPCPVHRLSFRPVAAVAERSRA